MTCIVGYLDKKEKKIWMGGDSAGVGGYSLSLREDSKVFIKDGMIYGFTSSFRMGQIIRSCFDRPKHYAEDGKSDYDYLCGPYIDELLKCFKEKHYAKLDNNVASGGLFLLGYKDKLYNVQSDFQVGQNLDLYDAAGCGHDLALGALFALDKIEKEALDTKELKLKPRPSEEKVRTALEAASKFSAGVSAPHNIISLGFFSYEN